MTCLPRAMLHPMLGFLARQVDGCVDVDVCVS